MANERPLLLSEARGLLYKHATDEVDTLAGKDAFSDRLNEALERIYTEGIWDGLQARVDLNASGSSYISDEILTLPYAYEAMLSIAIDEDPTPIMGKQYEFMPGGPGLEDAGEGGSFVIDLGFSEDDSLQSVRKYKILQNVSATTKVEGILKRRFVYLSSDTDKVYPSNIGAIKHALLAIAYEDEGDIERSTAYWEECYSILHSAKQLNRAGIINPNPQQQWGFMTNKPTSII
tara:strand:- start:5 stop:703 length:699 start_codon:yes stop_codon:yes gene_type:complete